MTYVCSDIHGHLQKYLNFLASGRFDEDDTLYIIGDVLDRGKDGIPLLQDIMRRENVHLILGNHEAMLLPVFVELLHWHGSEGDMMYIIKDEQRMSQYGQAQTLYDFSVLPKKEKQKIIRFIEKLPLYKELTVNKQKYILVHAGLPDYNNYMEMEFFTKTELLFGPHDFTATHFEDTIVVVGHKPTCYIQGAVAHQIYKSNDSIAIDCGPGFGGQLGVLCLDTGEELYY